MGFSLILVIVFLGSVAANFFHWRARGGGRFFYDASSGWPGYLFFVWTIGTPLACVLFIMHTIPESVFIGTTVGMAIAQQMYSIARRQQRRARP